MNNNAKQQIERFWKETLRDNYLISEIDFEKDIDDEKIRDVNYFINNDGSLSFYGKIENDYKESDLLIENDNKKIFSTKIDTTKCKLIHIDTSNMPFNFFLLFSSKKYKQQLQNNIFELINNKKSKVKKEISTNIYYTLLDIYGCDIDIKTKDEIDFMFEETTISTNDIVKGIIIDLQNKKLTLLDVRGNKKDVYWPIVYEEEMILLSSVALGDKIKIYDGIKAYIYFKPIENMCLSKLEICMLYRGNPQLEYFNREKKKWIVVKKGSIRSTDKIELRVKMGLGDVIHSISLIKDKEDLHKEYKKLKVIDFNENIDVNKSGKFYINPIKKNVKFKMGEVKKLSIDDFEVLCGDVEADENGIKIMPKEHYSFRKNQSYSIIALKEPSEIYYIEYEKNGFHLRLKVGLEKNNILEYFKETIFQNNKIDPSIRNKLNSKLIETYFRGDYVLLVKNDGAKFEHIPICRENELKKYRNILLNISKRSICINNKQKHNVNFDIEKFFENREKKLRITVHHDKKNCKDYVLIKNILCGKNKGYIYFNNLGEFENPKFIYSNSNIEFEYYSYDEIKWININEIDESSINGELNLRCKMCSDDKLHNIFIVDDIC